MSEVAFKDLKSHLKTIAKHLSPLFLIYGDEFLRDQAVGSIVNALLPDPGTQKHHLEVITSREDGYIVDAIERLNTYAFFSGKKVVELRDDTLFSSRQSPPGQNLDKIKKVFETDRDGAAQMFLELLGRTGVDPGDLVDDHSIVRLLGLDDDQVADLPMITELARYCSEQHLETPAAKSTANGAELLKSAIEKGFPEHHYLIMVSATADKRTALYKLAADKGCVVDCSVASGTRKADRDAQSLVLRQFMQATLKKSGKQAEAGAFEMMADLTGFDMRTFAANLEKLISYASDRNRITAADVRTVLNQTREDPVYELTGAVSEKNTVRALYFLGSLLRSGYHYLQILSALTNQMRRLLLIKEFAAGPEGYVWQPGMNFTQFKNTVMPAIRAYDETITPELELVFLRDSANGKSRGQV